MARVGYKPITVPKGVEVAIKSGANETIVSVKGSKGSLEKNFLTAVAIEQNEGELVLKISESPDKFLQSLHGTYRAIINNMIVGVTEGFSKKLVWEGVGYKMQAQGQGLVINMGYSHDIKYQPVDGIQFLVEGNSLTISGIDKQVVGQVAAEIRDIRGPEPYKGKGIRYVDEVILRKAGKSAK